MSREAARRFLQMIKSSDTQTNSNLNRNSFGDMVMGAGERAGMELQTLKHAKHGNDALDMADTLFIKELEDMSKGM